MTVNFKFIKTTNISGKRIVVANNKVENEEVEILTPHDIVKMLKQFQYYT